MKIVSDYYTELMSRCSDGKMEPEVRTRTHFMLSNFHSYTFYFLQFSLTHVFMICPHLKEFKKIFRLAFPERPEDKLELLTTKVANVEKTDGKIRKLTDLI